ncbi:hypothetical protein [Clavibacter nebraskensis]|uniref:DUF5709 domain-containing protein n=2 Tax=Clavibacter nebraskensis TaxID=31963 RepID=A0AAI9EKS6_9MICO|nr:hypothetical protein [Clavibacter nebraskensis]KXU20238.1 hypothetical protein VV38_09930 [Clavibacter nebraskensis]OAH21485.1 hypothetical protein A3Q38_03485 [Clavibacter nebraskensis]QGV67177.1 hypothetical protein EGX36_10310 [Clavibacter nebraskensis]QGV69976.1 hypothetical protein EGX37_10265 [Clavibacter nebraskensis]QGV72767.1 hypothetical protein EGX35_10265 [Clavibacter nebraskensis]
MSDADDPTDGIRTGRGPGDPDGLVTVDDVVGDDGAPAGVGDAVRAPDGTGYGHAEEDTLEVEDADHASAAYPDVPDNRAVTAADSHMSAPADDDAGHVDPEGR